MDREMDRHERPSPELGRRMPLTHDFMNFLGRDPLGEPWASPLSLAACSRGAIGSSLPRGAHAATGGGAGRGALLPPPVAPFPDRASRAPRREPSQGSRRPGPCSILDWPGTGPTAASPVPVH